MSVLRAGSGYWAALVGAWMLVLQSVVGAVALGTGPGAYQLDAFGNPLCITGADHAGDASHRSDHSGLPNCCTLGCYSITVSSHAPGHQYAVLVFLPAAPLPPAQDYQCSGFTSRDHDPGRPRAPPLTV